MKDNKKKDKKNRSGWWFLSVVLFTYLIISIFDTSLVKGSLAYFLSIIKKILPVFLLVFIIMVLVNYLVKPKKLTKYLGRKAGFKGWAISILGGIISTGAIYMWYPLLEDLKSKGMRDAYIAAFLYNRAIKPALIPLLVLYLGFKYMVVLTIVMIIASIIQGFAVEAFIRGVKKSAR